MEVRFHSRIKGLSPLKEYFSNEISLHWIDETNLFLTQQCLVRLKNPRKFFVPICDYSLIGLSSRIDPRQPRCRQCDTMTSVYWRVPARDLLLCNNCFKNDLKNSNQFCKLKRLDTNIEEIPTLENRFHSSNPSSIKDEQVISSSSSSSSSMTTNKGKRTKQIEPVKSQLTIKISTRQQPTFRSNRKTLAFKSKKVCRQSNISSAFSCSVFFSSQKNVSLNRQRSNYLMFCTQKDVVSKSVISSILWIRISRVFTLKFVLYFKMNMSMHLLFLLGYYQPR